MKRLSSQQAQQLLRKLDDDLQHYNVWLRTLLCAVIDGANMCVVKVEAGGHDFGLWFYGDEGALLRSLDSYSRVARTHHLLHATSEQIRKQLCAGERVSGDDISLFIDQSNAFRRHVHALELEIRDYVCALDPLTGVLNRHQLVLRLGVEAQRARRNGHCCAIALMDIDHFKKINDQYGHNVGDRVLLESTGIIADSLREYDLMFRVGGEEFLICLPYLDAKRGRIAAERLRNKLGGHTIHVGENLDLTVTASFGVSLLEVDADPENSIDHADQALYAAKENGRNRVEVWEERA